MASVVVLGGEGRLLFVRVEGFLVVGFECLDVVGVRGVGCTCVALTVVRTADVAGVAGLIGIVVGGRGRGGGGGLVGDGDGGVVVWDGDVVVRTGTTGREGGGMQMDGGDEGGVGGHRDSSGSGSGGGNVQWADHTERPGSCVDRGAEKGADAHEGKWG